MADELQALLDRITEEGLKKADAERRVIVEKAQSEAEQIVASAREQADSMVEEAKREAAVLHTKGEEALRQAARDVMLSLRRRLEERVSAVAKALVQEALPPERMAELLGELISSFVSQGGVEDRVEVLLNDEQCSQVESALKARLGSSFKDRCELSPVPSLSGGFRLQLGASDVEYDFSDESLAEALAAFVSPRLAAIVLGDNGTKNDGDAAEDG